MLRARLSNGAFVLGLDDENIKRLTAGHPIIVCLAQLGGTDDVIIMHGASLEAIKAELEAVTGKPLPPQSKPVRHS